MAFHEIQFPHRIAFGSSGGPERKTEIVTLGSGFEERNAVWAHSRRRYDVGYGVTSLNDVHAVIAFFEARMGRLHGFRFKDFADFTSRPPEEVVTPQDQFLGAGDGTQSTFALRKNYVSGAQSWTRTIAKPVQGTVHVALNGIEQMTGWSVDVTTGLISFAVAPSAGAVVTAGFEFDVPVRFDTDILTINLEHFRAGQIVSIPIVEIRP